MIKFKLTGHYDPFADIESHYFAWVYPNGSVAYHTEWFDPEKPNISKLREEVERVCGNYEIPVDTKGDDYTKWHEADDCLL